MSDEQTICPECEHPLSLDYAGRCTMDAEDEAAAKNGEICGHQCHAVPTNYDQAAAQNPLDKWAMFVKAGGDSSDAELAARTTSLVSEAATVCNCGSVTANGERVDVANARQEGFEQGRDAGAKVVREFSDANPGYLDAASEIENNIRSLTYSEKQP